MSIFSKLLKNIKLKDKGKSIIWQRYDAEGFMGETVDYTKEMKKKFKKDDYSEYREQLKTIPDDELIIMHGAHRSNIHINGEMKRRGIEKVK